MSMDGFIWRPEGLNLGVLPHALILGLLAADMHSTQPAITATFTVLGSMMGCQQPTRLSPRSGRGRRSQIHKSAQRIRNLALCANQKLQLPRRLRRLHVVEVAPSKT